MRKFAIYVGLATAAAMAGCSQGDRISNRIAKAAADTTIDLAALTPFAWDRAVVFGPYTTKNQICAALPASSAPCATAYPNGVDEGSYLLAFIRGANVVHHELHPRANGDFCSDSCTLALTPKTSRFNVLGDSRDGERRRFSQVIR